MKWLIVSDTHGYYRELCDIFEKEKDIENVIFLGDGLHDIARAKMDYPHLKFQVVRGNCDIPQGQAPMQILNIKGYKVLICHGDGFDVKHSKLALRRAAIQMGVDIALYGHTHQQYYEYMDGLYIFCPGSVAPNVSTGYCTGYGIMDFENSKPEIYNCIL